MGYHIDLSSVSIDTYKKKLIEDYLPPSRMILKEKSDERLEYFKNIGIENLEDLIGHLKKKGAIDKLKELDLYSEKYLKVLLRELKSLHPKPVKLVDCKIISSDIIDVLADIGIKNTVKLYTRIQTVKERNDLASSLGVEEGEILRLTKLTDLSRIKWVGATFARILFELGIDTAEKVAEADPEALHKNINNLIKEKGYYRGSIGLNDVKILVRAAGDLPFEIEY